MDGSRRLTLTVPETAELLGVSRAFAYTLVARGELPSLRLGRRVVVPRVAIDALVSSCLEGDPSGGNSRSAGSLTVTTDTQPDTADNPPNENTPTPTTTNPQPPRRPTTPTPRPQPAKPLHTLAPGVRGSDRSRSGAR